MFLSFILARGEKSPGSLRRPPDHSSTCAGTCVDAWVLYRLSWALTLRRNFVALLRRPKTQCRLRRKRAQFVTRGHKIHAENLPRLSSSQMTLRVFSAPFSSTRKKSIRSETTISLNRNWTKDTSGQGQWTMWAPPRVTPYEPPRFAVDDPEGYAYLDHHGYAVFKEVLTPGQVLALCGGGGNSKQRTQQQRVCFFAGGRGPFVGLGLPREPDTSAH